MKVIVNGLFYKKEEVFTPEIHTEDIPLNSVDDILTFLDQISNEDDETTATAGHIV